MKVYLYRPAEIVLKAVLAGVLCAVVCFGQSPAKAGSAKSQPAAEPASSPQKVVMRVGNVEVTQAEMDFLIQNLNPQVRQAVAQRGRGALGEEYSLMLLLYQKAMSEHLDAAPKLQRELALQKHQLLAQAEYRNIESKVSVNPEEVSTYYTAHKSDFEQASIREFVVRKKAPNAKPGDPGLTPEAAKARLDSIRKAIAAGTAIDQVAKQFEVPNVVIIGTKARAIRRGQLLPALDKMAFELKDDQFSDPVDTPQALVAIQVISHQQAELKSVSPEIENNLRQQKTQAELNDLKTKANIWMDPDYFKNPGSPQTIKPKAAAPSPAHP